MGAVIIGAVLSSVSRHVRHYAKWYAVVVAWAVAVAILPVVHATPPAAAGAPSGSAGASAAETPLPARAAAAVATLPPRASAAAPIGAGPAADSPPSAAPGAVAPTPRASRGLHLPAPPSVPTPQLPSAATPLLAPTSPVAADVCAGIGLARLGLFLGGSAVPQIPIAGANAYLVPAYNLCALFPTPATFRCPLDDAIAAREPRQLVGIATPPPVEALPLQELAALPLPFFPLASALGCAAA
ncbi:MAG TPA: hypothetical protein VHC63_11040 [Acidimicrobiales bacterium]|nr:hypothetical protein [Acidimicrobiales bacterium]